LLFAHDDQDPQTQFSWQAQGRNSSGLDSAVPHLERSLQVLLWFPFLPHLDHSEHDQFSWQAHSLTVSGIASSSGQPLVSAHVLVCNLSEHADHSEQDQTSALYGSGGEP
jgi:hypothetical protein